MSSSVKYKVVSSRYRKYYSPKSLWVFDELFFDHVGLPLVVILAVHLVIFCVGWV